MYKTQDNHAAAATLAIPLSTAPPRGVERFRAARPLCFLQQVGEGEAGVAGNGHGLAISGGGAAMIMKRLGFKC